MGFFSGITDFVGDVFGGLSDNLGLVGSALGSVIPGVGTALGGMVGSGLQMLSGSSSSSSLPFMGSNDAYGQSSGLNFSMPNLGGAWNAVSPFLPSIVSGGLGYLGQSSANAANQQQALNQMAFQDAQNLRAMQFSGEQSAAQRDQTQIQATLQRQWQQDQNQAAMAFSGQEANKAMQFAERMSNTSWQRGVKDMQAAGLNPMLAFSRGGASAPGGSMGSGFAGGTGGGGGGAAGHGVSSAGASAVMLNAMAPMLNSAMAWQRGLAEIEQVNAQTDRIRVQTNLDRALTGKALQDTATSSSSENVNRAYAGNLSVRYNQMLEEINLIREKIPLTKLQAELVHQEVINALYQGRRIQADTRDITANAVLRELMEPRARNIANVQDTSWMRNVSPFLSDSHQIYQMMHGTLFSPFRFGR